MLFKFNQKGNFEKTMAFLKSNPDDIADDILRYYGEVGVRRLSDATPVDTGATSDAWYYKLIRKKGRLELQFCNRQIENGIKVAVIIQYGHATRNGGWVEGIDYINPALKPVFDDIIKSVWEEVCNI